MSKTTLTSRFLAGFEPIELPARGPDGMIPAGPAKMSLPVLHPSLCEAGPCTHYHRMVSVMDAQDPIGGVGPVRRMVTRVCYPSLGSEVELGETPVLQCSKWAPNPDNEQGRLDGMRAQFLRTSDGRAFAAKVEAFEVDTERRQSTPLEHDEKPATDPLDGFGGLASDGDDEDDDLTWQVGNGGSL